MKTQRHASRRLTVVAAMVCACVVAMWAYLNRGWFVDRVDVWRLSCSTSQATRFAAAQRLAARGTPAALQALAARLMAEDETEVARIRDLLSELGIRALPAVMDIAFDRGIPIDARRAAIRVLKTTGASTDASLSGLVKCLHEPELAVAAQRALESMGKAGEDAAIVAASSHLPSVRRNAAQILWNRACSGLSALGVAKLIDLSSDPDPDVRATAMNGIAAARHQAQAAIPAMKRLMTWPDARDRGRAAWVLGSISTDPRDADLLVSLMVDPELRECTIEGLGRMGQAASGAVAAVKAAVDDPDEAVRRTAIYALWRIAPAVEAVPVLRAALADSDPEVRDEALAGLDQVGDRSEETVQALRRLLSDTIRSEASSGLDALLVADVLTNLSDSEAAFVLPVLESALADSSGAPQDIDHRVQDVLRTAKKLGAGAARLRGRIQPYVTAANPETARLAQEALDNMR